MLGVVIGGAMMGESESSLIASIQSVRAAIGIETLILVQAINCPKLVSLNYTTLFFSYYHNIIIIYIYTYILYADGEGDSCRCKSSL